MADRLTLSLSASTAARYPRIGAWVPAQYKRVIHASKQPRDKMGIRRNFVPRSPRSTPHVGGSFITPSRSASRLPRTRWSLCVKVALQPSAIDTSSLFAPLLAVDGANNDVDEGRPLIDWSLWSHLLGD
jgi:hypothetical protein